MALSHIIGPGIKGAGERVGIKMGVSAYNQVPFGFGLVCSHICLHYLVIQDFVQKALFLDTGNWECVR